MKKTNMTEKMPKFMQDAIGQAQKRLTLLEGEARTLFTGTINRIMENPSMKKMSATMTEWSTKSKQWPNRINLEPIRKRMETVRNSVSQKAAVAIGLATQTDIRSIRSKVERLRDEIRKYTRGGHKATSKPASN